MCINDLQGKVCKEFETKATLLRDSMLEWNETMVLYFQSIDYQNSKPPSIKCYLTHDLQADKRQIKTSWGMQSIVVTIQTF